MFTGFEESRRSSDILGEEPRRSPAVTIYKHVCNLAWRSVIAPLAAIIQESAHF